MKFSRIAGLVFAAHIFLFLVPTESPADLYNKVSAMTCLDADMDKEPSFEFLYSINKITVGFNKKIASDGPYISLEYSVKIKNHEVPDLINFAINDYGLNHDGYYLTSREAKGRIGSSKWKIELTEIFPTPGMNTDDTVKVKVALGNHSATGSIKCHDIQFQ